MSTPPKVSHLAPLRIGMIILGLVAIATAIIIFIQQPSDTAFDKVPHAKRFQQEYPEVAKDNRYVYISEEDAVEMFNQGSGLILLGFKECPWCQQLAPMIDKAAKAEGLETIHYLDIRQARAENSEAYQQLVNTLEPHLERDENGQPRIFVPDVSVVKNGEIVGRFQQEKAPASESTPDTFWTDERRQRADGQLRELIIKLNANNPG